MWAGEQWTLTRSEVIWKLPATSLTSSLCKTSASAGCCPQQDRPLGVAAMWAGEQWTSTRSEVIWKLPATSLRPPDAAHSKTAHLE